MYVSMYVSMYVCIGDWRQSGVYQDIAERPYPANEEERECGESKAEREGRAEATQKDPKTGGKVRTCVCVRSWARLFIFVFFVFSSSSNYYDYYSALLFLFLLIVRSRMLLCVLHVCMYVFIYVCMYICMLWGARERQRKALIDGYHGVGAAKIVRRRRGNPRIELNAVLSKVFEKQKMSTETNKKQYRQPTSEIDRPTETQTTNLRKQKNDLQYIRKQKCNHQPKRVSVVSGSGIVFYFF